jgi:hypothetical protein
MTQKGKYLNFIYITILFILFFTDLFYFNNYKKVSEEYTLLVNNFSDLKSDYEELKKEYDDFTMLLNETTIGVGSSVRKVLVLEYFRQKVSYPPIDIGNPIAVIYSYQDNSTLKLDLLVHYSHPELFIPLCVQQGIAYKPIYKNNTMEERAPIILYEELKETNSISVKLKEKGWYTISLEGPISPGGGRSIIGVIWENDDVRVIAFSVQLIIHVSTQENDRSIFAVNEFINLGS